jgi:hypothetical protein
MHWQASHYSDGDRRQGSVHGKTLLVTNCPAWVFVIMVRFFKLEFEKVNLKII